MLKLAKWLGIIILLPILVIREVYAVLAESGISIPDADDVLCNIKEQNNSTKCDTTK